jgi:microcystin-dependent protein
MDCYMGMIFPWAMNWAPVNFMLCQGQILAVNSNQPLYTLIGNIYGGSAPNTFALPNLQGVFPLGAGRNMQTGQFYLEGETAGASQTALSQAQMPMHTHAATFTGTGGGGGGPIVASLQASKANATTSAPGANTYLSGLAVDSTNARADTYNTLVSAPAASTLGPVSWLSVTGGGGGITGGTVMVGMAGESLPVPIMPPYLVLNYIICVNGLFPSRQ